MQNIADWFISGSIGLIFGLLSAWVTYRYQRKRDDIAWAREKLKLQEQFAHEKELLERQFQQQAERQKQSQLREALTRGVDNAAEEIKALERSIKIIASSGGHLSPVSADELRSLAQGLVSSVSSLRSAISAIESRMPAVRSFHANVSADVRRWETRKSGLVMNLQDAVAASRIIQDIADAMDQG